MTIVCFSVINEWKKQTIFNDTPSNVCGMPKIHYICNAYLVNQTSRYILNEGV